MSPLGNFRAAHVPAKMRRFKATSPRVALTCLELHEYGEQAGGNGGVFPPTGQMSLCSDPDKQR